MNTLDAIHTTIKACHDCPLRAGCVQPVPGEGPFNAQVMFVGEGPGAREDEEGKPFMGPSGLMLRDMIAEAVGTYFIGTDQVKYFGYFFTNIVKCRPPNNRDPKQSEIHTCLHYLDEQIEAINPKVIVPVGRYAMAQFLPDDSIMKVHGTPHIVHGRIILPIIHTAAALRAPELRPLIAADLRLIPRLLATPIALNPGTMTLGYLCA